MPTRTILPQGHRRAIRREAHDAPALERWLEGEREAATRTASAIEALGDRVELVELRDCLRSHRRRALLLEEELALRIGAPPERAPRADEGPASLAELETIEADLAAEYGRGDDAIGAEARLLLSHDLVPDQRRTLRAITRLHRQSAA